MTVHLCRLVLLIALCAASIDPYWLALVNSTQIHWQLVAAFVAIAFGYLLLNGGVKESADGTSVDRFFNLQRRKLFFMPNLYPTFMTDAESQNSLLTKAGPLSLRLEKLLRLPTVRQASIGVIILSAFMFFNPGLPDFLLVADLPAVRSLIRYATLSIMVSNTSLQLFLLFNRKETKS